MSKGFVLPLPIAPKANASCIPGRHEKPGRIGQWMRAPPHIGGISDNWGGTEQFGICGGLVRRGQLGVRSCEREQEKSGCGAKVSQSW